MVRMQDPAGYFYATVLFKLGKKAHAFLDGSDPGEVSVTVSNQGPPIDAELLPKIFEPFTVGPMGQDGRRRSVGLVGGR